MLGRAGQDDSPSRPARLDSIEHIVVLMLENRSFDHRLGYLALPGHGLEDRGELPVRVNGLDLDDPAFVNTYTDASGATLEFRPEPLAEDVFGRDDLDPHTTRRASRRRSRAAR